MTLQDLAAYIEENKPGLSSQGVHMGGPLMIVLQYTRKEMSGDVHITDEHILECCAKANTYEEHIALCRPIAKTDTENFLYQQRHKPVPKGRTRNRRFK